MKRSIASILILLITVFPIMAQISVAQNESASTWNMQTVEPLSGTDEWPMFHHDPQNTGYSTSTAPTTNSIGWSFTTAGSWVYSPSVSDGKIYFGSSDHNVYCLNAFTGEKLWDYTTSDIVRSSPAVSNGRVYVGSDDQKIYCLATSTGDLIWMYDTSAGAGSFVSSPVVVDGKIFIGLDKCYCLNASNGNPLWDYYVDGYFINSSPAVFDGKVYAEFSNGELHCLNASNGETVWMHDSNSAGDCSPAVANGKVYIASNDGTVYCLDAATGDPIWTLSDFLEPATFGLTCPAIAEDRLYIGSVNQWVYCMNASTGDLHWGQKTGNSVHSSPAVADGKVYICSDKAYCLNATVGEPIWTYTTGVYIGSSSPAVAYGNVYVGSDKLYCFGSASPTVHNLDTGLDYLTIQAAIDAPETLNGHTIQVDAGTYYENVVVNKSLALIGEDRSNTIIDGGELGPVLALIANNVTLTNFTLANSSVTGNAYGLLLNGCNNTKIENNTITQNYAGVVLSNSANNIFRNNALVDNVWNIGVSGQDVFEYFLQDIDTSNTVNGKPIYYWINHENEQVPSDAGFVALVNCTNVLVESLNLKNNYFGLQIAYSSNTTVQNNNITDNYCGIAVLYGSYDNQIIENVIEQNYIGVFGYGLSYRPNNNSFIENTITANDLGIYMWRTQYNTIRGNSITANDRGIYFWTTYNSSVYENNIRDNERGIGLTDNVKWNRFYHNNIVNNTVQASASSLNTEDNAWDNGYPSGGNYWSNYNGTDTDGDGIGDTPYVIDENNQDNYPLAGPFGVSEHVFNVTVDDTTIPVAISSNSSISEFDFSDVSLQVSFNVTGLTGTTGFCNITLPEDLLWGDFSVYMNGEPLVEGLDYTRTYNGTHNIFHITYTHSSHLIEITGTHVIPEHSSLIILSLLLTATLLIVTNKKRLFRQH